MQRVFIWDPVAVLLLASFILLVASVLSLFWSRPKPGFMERSAVVGCVMFVISLPFAVLDAAALLDWISRSQTIRLAVFTALVGGAAAAAVAYWRGGGARIALLYLSSFAVVLPVLSALDSMFRH